MTNTLRKYGFIHRELSIFVAVCRMTYISFGLTHGCDSSLVLGAVDVPNRCLALAEIVATARESFGGALSSVSAGLQF